MNCVKLLVSMTRAKTLGRGFKKESCSSGWRSFSQSKDGLSKIPLLLFRTSKRPRAVTGKSNAWWLMDVAASFQCMAGAGTSFEQKAQPCLQGGISLHNSQTPKWPCAPRSADERGRGMSQKRWFLLLRRGSGGCHLSFWAASGRQFSA